MAKKRFIEINKGKCIAYLFHALINLKKPTPFKWEFLIKLKLLKNTCSMLKGLIFAGLTVAQLFTGFNLSAESQKLESTVFADFDKDGDTDTAKISPGTGIVSFHEKFWNNFEVKTVPLSNFTPDAAGGISDNHNYQDDLFLMNQSSGKYAILSETGSEGFVVQTSGVLNTPINEAILEDFDQDGDDDLVYASSNGTIGWAKNNGTDGFMPQGNLINGLSTDVSSIDLIDYDSDGDMDIKFTSGGIAQLQQNYGSEGFSPNENYNSSEDYHFHQADINSDGQKDSMTVSKGGLVQVSKSQGTEGFAQTSNLQTKCKTRF